MARMFPERLAKDVESEAERRLFEQFKRDFSDDFAVFHGVSWLGKRRSGGAFDGEADFVIAHPKHGVLVLEVKGGGVGYDARTGRWQSIDRAGAVHEIKSPLEQAKRSKYALRDKLREAANTAKYQFPLAHAVAFPDTEFTAPMQPDLSPQIVIDLPKARELKQSVIDAYRFFRGDEREPGGEAIGALVDVLGRSWSLPPLLSATLAAGEDRVRELTEQQFALLDFLGRRPRALIRGGAGTGKTMLALEKARRLSREGFRVLMTCFNANLAAWMARELEGARVEVMHFHRLCSEFAQRAGTPIERKPDEADSDFFGRFPDALFDAAAAVADRYDAIIVDEGQDFEEEWWVPLLELLADGRDGVLYIFYDDNQRIYRRKSKFPLVDEPFALSTNCRNTLQIHELVGFFYEGDEQTCHGPEGERVDLIEVTADGSERDAVGQRIGALIEREKVAPQDIVILTPRSKERSEWRHGSGQPWQLTWDPEATGKVLCSTIHAFKGLERPVVVVVELSDIAPGEKSELLYVGFSRARQYLAVAGLDLAAVATLRVGKEPGAGA